MRQPTDYSKEDAERDTEEDKAKMQMLSYLIVGLIGFWGGIAVVVGYLEFFS